MNSFRYFDSVIQCELELPELLATSDDSGAIRVYEGPIDRSLIGEPRHEWEEFSCFEKDGSYLLEFPDLMGIQISPDEAKVVFDRSEAADDELVKHLLLDHALPRMFSHKGETVIHASAITNGEISLVFVGETGAGKSTMAAAFAADGWQVLSDDAVLLREDQGKVFATGSYSSVRLADDGFAEMESELGAASTYSCYSGKHRMLLKSGTNETVSIDALVFLDRCEDIVWGEMKGSESLMRLVSESFVLDPVDASAAAERLYCLSTVIEAVPGMRLGVPHCYSDMARTKAHLLRVIGCEL